MYGKSAIYFDNLGNGELAVFCGAGISKNSGLPLAKELKQYILEKLPIDKGDTDAIMKSALPFEAFMETVLENTDISNILEIFKNGNPNTNHILIARLAKKGYLKTIVTTNFDLLVEKALEKEGLKENVHFKKYYDEDSFSKLEFDTLGDKIGIFKIHGSIDNLNSIRTTLKVVGSKSLSDKRMNLLKYLFSTGSHKKVLILGYSCSDDFDITPQIQSLEKNKKDVIFIEHSKKEIEEIEDIKIKDNKNPFKNFSGVRIKCNSDRFIEKLWYSFQSIAGEYQPIVFDAEWHTHINNWWIKVFEENKGLPYKIAGSMFYTISNYKRAIEYDEISLEIAKDIWTTAQQSRIYTHLGLNYRSLNDFNKAIECHNKSLEIAKKIKDDLHESRSYVNIGNVYHGLGDFNKAIEYYENSLIIAKRFEDNEIVAACYQSLGACYRNLRYFEKAIKYFEKSLEISQIIGDKKGESGCFSNLGTTYHGLMYLRKAIEYHEKSLKIDNEIGDRAGESFCYCNIGLVHGDSGNYRKAIEYYEMSSKIAQEIGLKSIEGGCLAGLGIAYDELGDCNKAIELLLAAEKIFNGTKQIHYQKAVYKNLVLIYEKIGEFDNAWRYQKMSQEIN